MFARTDGVDHRLLPVPGEPAALRRTGVRRAVFLTALVVALLLGRSWQASEAHLALFWPAAAVGLLWTAGSTGRRGQVVDLALVAAATSGVRLVTGVGLPDALLLGAAGAVQAGAGAWAARLLEPSGLRLTRPHHLRTLALASVAGAVCSLPLALAGFAGTSDLPLPLVAVLWSLRTTVSAFVVVAVALRVGERRLGSTRAPGRRHVLEGLALAAYAAAAYVVAFWVLSGTAVAFLVLPASVWIALRWSTTWSTVQVVLAAAVVVVSTWSDRGPWSDLPPDWATLAALAFIGTLALVTLLLALYRDEGVAQAERADAARAEAADQAALLEAVFGSISDAVSVIAADGTPLLRNPAAVALLGPLTRQASPDDWRHTFAVVDAAGDPVPQDDLPLVRALRGEDVHGVDLHLARPADGTRLVVNASAHPLRGTRGGAVHAFHDVTEIRATAAEVQRSRDLFAAVLDGAAEHAIVAVDLDGLVTVFNAGAERMLGYREEELLGRPAALVHDLSELVAIAADRGVVGDRELYALIGSAPGPTTRQATYVRKDGSTLQVRLTTSAMRGPDGTVHGYLGMASDLTAQLAAEEELAASEAFSRAAFETAPTGIVLVAAEGDEAGRVVQVNRSTERITGRTGDELLGSVFADLAGDVDAADVAVRFAPLLLGEAEHADLDLPVDRPDGEHRELTVSATRTTARGVGAVVLCLLEDVTDRRAAARHLQHQALHDALTGLPNRTLLVDRLEHALSAVQREGEEVGLLYLDLDGFKAVNDTAGHAAGDELLRQVAQAFQGAVRPGDTVARLGGDEFAVICPHASGDDLVGVAGRLLSTLEQPFRLGGHDAVVGASVGVRADDGTGTTDQVLRDADAAMYRAKRAGKGRVVVHGAAPQPVPAPALR